MLYRNPSVSVINGLRYTAQFETTLIKAEVSVMFPMSPKICVVKKDALIEFYTTYFKRYIKNLLHINQNCIN